MKRWLIVLLIFVLPLQMSWASLHVCDDSSAPAASEFVFTDGHSAADAASSLADACCASAHACHGLHTAMCECSPFLAVTVPASSHLSFTCLTLGLGGILTAIDRPQWHPA